MFKSRLLLIAVVALAPSLVHGQPFITNVTTVPSPPTAGTAFDITVFGNRFCGGVIQLDNQSIPTTASSGQNGTQLSGTVPGSLTVNQAGVHNVTVFVSQNAAYNCDSSSGTSAPFQITLVAPPLVLDNKALPQGDVGIPYAAQASASGGQSPYTFSVQGQLPPGLNFSPTNGAFGGTPTTAGSYDFSITVRDSPPSNQSVTLPFNITIRPPLQIPATSFPSGVVNQPYSATLIASGGLPPFSWSLIAGAPPGLSFSAAGVLSGTPTQAGDYNVTVRVTDRNSTQVTKTLPLSIRSVAQPLQVTTTSLPGVTPGVFYSTQLAAAGGTQPFTWSTTSVLPTGLSLSPGGILSGTTSQTGTFPVTVTVRDSAGITAQASYSLVVSPSLTIQTVSIPAGIPGTFYTTLFTAAGGLPPYSWTTASPLPAGITLGQDGTLSGVTQQAGSFPLVVVVHDSSGLSAQGIFNLQISAALQILTSALPSGTSGSPYSFTFSAAGGASSNYTWSTTSTLPAGLTLGANGVLSGTPQQSGAFTIQVSVTDGRQTASGSFTLVISNNLQITTTSLPPYTPLVFYTTTLTATGGTAPYTWSTVSQLPSGIVLGSNGILSGTTQQTGSFPLLVVVRDANGQTSQATLTLAGNNTIVISTQTLPAAQLGIFYVTPLTATGGVPPYTWTTVDSLPPGFTLDPATGNLSGTGALQGTYNFTVQVRDSINQTATRVLTLVVGNSLNITNTVLATGIVGTPYVDNLAATGGTPPYQWQVVGAPVPGLALDFATGALTGTPVLSGIFNLTIRVTDTFGVTATKTFAVTINPGFKITNDTIPPAVVGSLYQVTFVAAGGTPPYTWSTSGVIPPGLLLNPVTGTLSGVPTIPGGLQFTVIATDSLGLQTSRPYTLLVNQNIAISPDSLPAGTVGVAYSRTLTAAGGSAPYSFAITSGSIPGLALDATGLLSGTPTQAGSFPLTIRITDATGQAGVKQYTVTILATVLQIAPDSIPDGITGVPYSSAITASGGTGPYSFQVTAGALPSGLTLSSTGAIGGTPAVSGTFGFTVRATDTNSVQATKTYNLTVATGIKITQSGMLPAGIVSSSYSTTLTATGGTPPYQWRISQGSLPAGVSLDVNSGQITGIATNTGTFPFSVEVTDAAGRKTSADLTLAVNPTLLRFTSSPTLPDATAGLNFTFSPAATGGTAPYIWSLNGAPAGLQIDPATGAIRGSVMSAGTFPFSIRVTDSAQVSSSQAVSLRVVLPPTPGSTISGLGSTVSANQQLSPKITLSQAYPLPLTGQLTMSFTPVSGPDDPAYQFSSGGRSVNFTVPAGDTNAVFSLPNLGLQTGTVAGTITLTARYLQGTTDVTPTPAPTVQVQIPSAAPVISSAQANRNASGFDLVLTVFATSREITSATVHLQTSGNVAGADFTVNLASVTAAWYQSAQSAQFGSLLKLTIPFTVQGSTGTVTGATVTLMNSVGASQPVSVSF